MRSHLRNRARAQNYSSDLAKVASSILYQSPIPSKAGHPIYILNAAALPDVKEVEYNALLPYVIARLPGEEELVSGAEYEVIFFAGTGVDGSASAKRSRPGWGWLIQAYHLLSRAMRKRIQKLYIVHERTWVRMITGMFSSVVSPKFRRKIVHAGTLTQLALHIPIEDLLIPPSAYLQDRAVAADIYSPYASGKRAFAARTPLPVNFAGVRRLPRVLRETTSFILLPTVVVTEGLFRIPAPAKLKEVLREAYDRGQKFIIWKNHDSLLEPPRYAHVNTADLSNTVQELDPSETYGPHIAAGLIKLWYSELREPIVPHTVYKDLLRLHGDAEVAPTLDQMIDLVSPASEWSILSATSRELLVRHLLPMLSVVASHEDFNKMSAENLAVCFAPTFVCGPDQMQDIKISSIVRRLLTALISNWPDLEAKCGLERPAFWDNLTAPAGIDDYEDPLDEQNSVRQEGTGPTELDAQQSGIILEDKEETGVAGVDSVSSSGVVTTLAHRPLSRGLALDTSPPPLPPRTSNAAPASGSAAEQLGFNNSAATPSTSVEATSNTPAARVGHIVSAMPPRYSTVFGPNTAESPNSYMSPADGFGPPRRGDWSIQSSDVELPAPQPPPRANNDSADSPSGRATPTIKRKPVASSESTTQQNGS